MKVRPGDLVNVNHGDCTLGICIQDASKSDVVLGEVKEIISGSPESLSVGSIMEFKRGDLV